MNDLDKLFGTDENGNAIYGSYLGIDINNSVIYSHKGLVAAIGVDNMVIINTGDVILICPKDRVQDVRALMDKLNTEDLKSYL